MAEAQYRYTLTAHGLNLNECFEVVAALAAARAHIDIQWTAEVTG